MWCRNCQQDVPAIGSTDESAVRCARCRKPFPGEAAAETSGATTDAAPVDKLRAAADASTGWLEKALREDWELEDELNEAQQLVASLGVQDRGASAIRIDGARAR